MEAMVDVPVSHVSNVVTEILEQIINIMQERIAERIKERTRCVLHVMKEILVKHMALDASATSARLVDRTRESVFHKQDLSRQTTSKNRRWNLHARMC